jgi:hypothetical protein
MSIITQQYAIFLQQFDWNYFLTARSCYKIKRYFTSMKWAQKILKNDKVDKVFYVVERDKGDMTNKHVHMLLETNKTLSYSEARKALGNISVGDYQFINNPKAVTNYVTKWVDSDCEYNFLL